MFFIEIVVTAEWLTLSHDDATYVDEKQITFWFDGKGRFLSSKDNGFVWKLSKIKKNSQYQCLKVYVIYDRQQHDDQIETKDIKKKIFV